MNLLIVSDLHIGKNDLFGTFGWDCYEFIKTLEYYRYSCNIDKIVLNGDIYELYKYPLEEIQKANPEIYTYLKRDYFYYIRGNHDLTNMEGAENFHMLNSNGQSIYMEHGHNADFLNGTHIGRILGKVGFYILKFFTSSKSIMKTYRKIVEYDDEVNRIPKKYNSYKYLKYALKLLKQHDLVVLGHTHKMETHKTYYLNQKKRYINSGSCSLGRFQAILLDTETLWYETIKIKKGEISSVSIAKEYLRMPVPA